MSRNAKPDPLTDSLAGLTEAERSDALRRFEAIRALMFCTAPPSPPRFVVCDAISARTRLLVSRFSGGRTEWNRARAGPPKTHANDAACGGPMGRAAGAV